MKRFMSVTSEALLSAAEIVIELSPSAVASLALEFALLLEGMAFSLRIRPSKGPTLLLSLTNDDKVSKGAVTRESDGSVHFALGRNQAEYLQAVLLRAFRDQIAEVNHVHIEGRINAMPFDLTVMFENFREPMTAEDAKNLLGS